VLKKQKAMQPIESNIEAISHLVAKKKTLHLNFINDLSQLNLLVRDSESFITSYSDKYSSLQDAFLKLHNNEMNHYAALYPNLEMAGN
jgi:Mg2+ and Co2+ transporter CorA